jgi:hypothetical protein
VYYSQCEDTWIVTLAASRRGFGQRTSNLYMRNTLYGGWSAFRWNQRDYIECQEGMSEGKGQSGRCDMDLCRANGESPSRRKWRELRRVRRTKLVSFRAHGTGCFLGERLSPFSQLINAGLPSPYQDEAIFPVHVAGMKLDYRFPNNVVHPSRLLFQNADVLKLYSGLMLCSATVDSSGWHTRMCRWCS